MPATDKIDLGVTADFHVHLRDGAMMQLVTPTVHSGCVSVAYIMPNLVPPVTSIEQAVAYHAALQKLSPETTFLMTFYLSKSLTPELVAEAARRHVIRGIKCYPAGVTTNSDAGVDPNDFSAFYPIFEAMEQHGLVLNLHGERPPTSESAASHDEDDHIHVLNAEPKFLPALFKLHRDFPRLKIVLEHCTTREAIEAIELINRDHTPGAPITVAASITAHHLSLTIDDWAGSPINFCKPVAKLPRDRIALVDAATSGKPYFFFGSDSAPHPLSAKARHVGVCAGVYTQSHALSYVAEVFDRAGKLDNLKAFVSDNGMSFYEITPAMLVSQRTASVVRTPVTVPDLIGAGELAVVPFKAGETLQWTATWN